MHVFETKKSKGAQMSKHRSTACSPIIQLGSAVIFIGLLTSAQPSSAAVITETFNFSESGFTGAPPVSPVVGSVTITWNNSASIADTATGITLNSLNIPLGSALEFNYDSSNDSLVFGGAASGVNYIYGNTDDFYFLISNVSTSPHGLFFGYSDVRYNTVYTTLNNGLTLGTPPVPEPITLAILAPALLGIGAARKLRRRS